MEPEPSIKLLRCEYLIDPLGIDERAPRLSWLIKSNRRGARQTAYRIGVASRQDALLAGKYDLWDTGRVTSDQTSQIEYAGGQLQSRMRCHWHVTSWDEKGENTLSSPALWTMGLLEPNDWQANWIAPDPEIIRRDPQALQATETRPGTPALFRQEFTVTAAIRRATLYATARGLLDVRLNGGRVSEDRFVPEWSDYHKRLHYRTFDVTDQVQTGENALAATLGDGWWSGYIGWQEKRGQYGTLENSLLLQLEIELENGQTVLVASNDGWLCNTGPILSSDFMLGEHYDARREHSGWDQPGFAETAWLPALKVPPPTVHIPHFGFSNNQQADTNTALPLVAQRSEPVRVVERLHPISVKKTDGETFIYDLGQNISGWVELTLSGAAGTQVRLRHGERLNPDGTLYTENLRRADATDVYVLKGDGRETWEPHFTFHGFQYIEISGLAEPLPTNDVTGCVAMSSTRQTGEFDCSHPLVNRLWQNALWGQKGNFLTVPTDCPQRDERLGWMGDAQVFLRTATYNMDVAAFFTKWMIDVTDSQDVDGVFPDVAPRLEEGEKFVGLDGLGGAAGWADAGIIVPWTLWRVYGDRRIVERHWEAMVRWLDWLETTNPKHIRENRLGNNYGDWLCIPSDTSFRTHSEMKTLLATAYWADGARKMAQLAHAIEKPGAAQRFSAMFNQVRAAFQLRWLNPNGSLTVDAQTAYLLGLAFDLIPAELRENAAKHLVENIKQLDWHLSTGFIGISHLNPILTNVGYPEVAYRLLCNEDYPSWLYPVLHGATTIWERWNGWTEAEGFFDPQMNSLNHYSLGSVGEWLYRHVAGIELDTEVKAFKRFVIKPYLGAGIAKASASYESIHGIIRSDWHVDGEDFRLEITIPPNTCAKVTLPCGRSSVNLREGQSIDECPHVAALASDDLATTLQVHAGEYCFVGKLSEPIASSYSV